MCGSCVTNTFSKFALTEAQKKAIKRHRAGKVKLVIMEKCYNCEKMCPEKDMNDSEEWLGKVCQSCFMKEPEEEEEECVWCGEYSMINDMVEMPDDQYGNPVWACECCYEDMGTECFSCGEKMFKDIEDHEAPDPIREAYYENCDDGDCCAECMRRIVNEYECDH